MSALIPCIMPERGHGTGLYTVTMDRDRGRGSERTAEQPETRENDAHALFAFSSELYHERLYRLIQRNRERVRQGDEHEQHTRKERYRTNKP